VRELRERRDWSAAELGRRAGCSTAAVIRIEQGSRHGLPGTRFAIADALGVEHVEAFPPVMERVWRAAHEQAA
jgi:transcriptional regulator with XRE-family HTH domain